MLFNLFLLNCLMKLSNYCYVYIYIYIADIGSFDGNEIPAPPNDPGVDLDDDQDMPDAEDHEAGEDTLSLHDALPI